MSNLFSGCSSLTSLDLSNFDTSKTISMESMFNECHSLEDINLSSFDTGKVSDFNNMFAFCDSLKTIDVSGFSTKNARTLGFMFYNCQNLEKIDVSNFDFSKTYSTENMFRWCESLKEIKFPSVVKFNKLNFVDTNIFSDCLNLKKFVFPEIEFTVQTKNNEPFIVFNQKENADWVIAELIGCFYSETKIHWGSRLKLIELITNGKFEVPEYEKKMLLSCDSSKRTKNIILLSIARHFSETLHIDYSFIKQIKDIDKIIQIATNENSDPLLIPIDKIKNSGAMSDIDAYLSGVPLDDILV